MDYRKHVLFVCAKNLCRSPTAEAMYARHPQLHVRSAGLRDSARHKINAADIGWADAIYVMERAHKKFIQEHFRDLKLPPIKNLNIPDNFGYMELELQHLVKLAFEPEIMELLASKDQPAG